MKHVFILILMSMVVATATQSYAQAPQSFKYQSIARDGADILLSDANIKLEISIHNLTPGGTVVYKERHSATTNSLGLFTISVGAGETADNFAVIDWGAGAKFIEVAADFTGGTNFLSLGTSQLLSVPYALHSSGGWGLTGNSGTVGELNFIGTTDNTPFNIKVNGEKSGNINSTGTTFFGYQSGTNNSNSSLSTGVGFRALYYNTSGNSNCAFGAEALSFNEIGSGNTAMGAQALSYNKMSNNTAIGFRSLQVNTNGFSNTATGTEALGNNTEGKLNTATGSRSLYNNSEGEQNTAIGSESLHYSTIGSANVAVGSSSMYFNSIGSGNTALGHQSLVQNTSGMYNTTIGVQSEQNNKTGSYNVAIGYLAGSGGENFSNCIAIGYQAEVYASNTVRIGNNQISQVFLQVPVSVTSDERLKYNIQDSELGLQFVSKLRPVQYIMKAGNGKIDYGFIAQELKEVLGDRNVNMLNKDGEYYHVRYNDLISPMVKAIQEQQQLIEQLKSDLAAVKSQLESKASENADLQSTLENRLKRLEAMAGMNPQN